MSRDFDVRVSRDSMIESRDSMKVSRYFIRVIRDSIIVNRVILHC